MGFVADDFVNCDIAYEVGIKAMENMEGKNFENLKLKRKYKFSSVLLFSIASIRWRLRSVPMRQNATLLRSKYRIQDRSRDDRRFSIVLTRLPTTSVYVAQSNKLRFSRFTNNGSTLVPIQKEVWIYWYRTYIFSLFGLNLLVLTSGFSTVSSFTGLTYHSLG